MIIVHLSNCLKLVRNAFVKPIKRKMEITSLILSEANVVCAVNGNIDTL